MFKVVPDQLRISEGWVRCGQCDEIFDASLHLLQAAPEEPVPAVRREGLAAKYAVTDSSDATPQPIEISLDSGRQGSPDEFPVEQEQLPPGAADDDEGGALRESIPNEFLQVDAVISPPMDWMEAQTEVSQSAPLTAAPPDRVANADPYDLDLDHSADFNDVSFLRDNKSRSFWHKRLIRAGLVLLSVALLLVLAGQIVFHERDRIAASEPGLKPWLLVICAHLNCTLSPLRRIESIVIDSSSFTKSRGDSYRLNFTLKNTATVALAMPAIELTLTDSLDQPVLRRVFLPAELGVKSDTLAAGSEGPASLAVAVKAGGMVDRVAGYRLLAFYP